MNKLSLTTTVATAILASACHFDPGQMPEAPKPQVTKEFMPQEQQPETLGFYPKRCEELQLGTRTAMANTVPHCVPTSTRPEPQPPKKSTIVPPGIMF